MLILLSLVLSQAPLSCPAGSRLEERTVRGVRELACVVGVNDVARQHWTADGGLIDRWSRADGGAERFEQWTAGRFASFVVETTPADGGETHACSRRLENGVVSARYGEGCEAALGLRQAALEARWPDGCLAYTPLDGGARYQARRDCPRLRPAPGAPVLLLEPTESERVVAMNAGELLHPGGGKLVVTTGPGFKVCLGAGPACFSAEKAAGLLVAWSPSGEHALINTFDGARPVSALFDVKKKTVRTQGAARFVDDKHVQVGGSVLDVSTGTSQRTGCADRARARRLADGSLLCLNLGQPLWLTRERRGKSVDCNLAARWLLDELDEGGPLALQPDAASLAGACKAVIGDLVVQLPGLDPALSSSP